MLLEWRCACCAHKSAGGQQLGAVLLKCTQSRLTAAKSHQRCRLQDAQGNYCDCSLTLQLARVRRHVQLSPQRGQVCLGDTPEFSPSSQPGVHGCNGRRHAAHLGARCRRTLWSRRRGTCSARPPSWSTTWTRRRRSSRLWPSGRRSSSGEQIRRGHLSTETADHSQHALVGKLRCTSVVGARMVVPVW